MGAKINGNILGLPRNEVEEMIREIETDLAWSRFKTALMGVFCFMALAGFVGMILFGSLLSALSEPKLEETESVPTGPMIDGEWIEVTPPGMVPGERCWVLSTPQGFAGIHCR